MLKLINHKNTIIIYSVFIFSLSSYFIFLNFFNESGYWFDEWCTLLSADPNVELKTIFERHEGNFEKPYENVPILYYLILRIFFNIFGYTSENGRIFSLIFLILSSLTFFFLLKLFINKRASLFATSIFFSTPLIVWMSNETRVDMFVVFFVLLNIFIFFLNLKFDRTSLKITLTASNVITLSVFPLTLSIIGSQILFLIIIKYLNNLKFNSSIIFIVISITLYFILNHDYFLERSLNRDYHFAKLNINFFILYYFNVFFGSVLFGIIFFLISIFFLLKKNKKILNDQLLLFCFISILSTYLMVILSSTLVTPIAAPRYIIFIIPIILIFIIKSSLDFKNKNIIFLFLFLLCTINISFNYDERHIKKPNTAQALRLIEKHSEKNVLVLPATLLFQNYILTVPQTKNLNLFLSFDEIEIKNIKNFAVLCLYKARFAGDEKTNKYEYCKKKYKGFEIINKTYVPDYTIRFFKKIND